MPEREHSHYLVPIFSDSDSRVPQTIVWGISDDTGIKFTQLPPMTRGMAYTLRYPSEGIPYQEGNIVFASGTLEFTDEGPMLCDATITYDNGIIKTRGDFYIAIREDTLIAPLQ